MKSTAAWLCLAVSIGGCQKPASRVEGTWAAKVSSGLETNYEFKLDGSFTKDSTVDTKESIHQTGKYRLVGTNMAVSDVSSTDIITGKVTKISDEILHVSVNGSSMTVESYDPAKGRYSVENLLTRVK